MFRALFEDSGLGSGSDAVFAPLAPPQPFAPLAPPQPQHPQQPFAPLAPPQPAPPPPPQPQHPLKPLPPDLPAERHRTQYIIPWNASPADTIRDALALEPQPQPQRAQQQRQQHPITRPNRQKAPATPARDLPYIPTYDAFIYMCSPDTKQLWQRTIVSNTRQLRDILSAISPIMGLAAHHVEVVFIARLMPIDGEAHTLTFRDDLGLELYIDGYPVPPNVPITIFPKDQSLIVRWSQATNNNYNMELSAMPYPLPITWFWATQEPNAPLLTFAVYERERGPPSRRRRAALFEEFRQPDAFTMSGAGTVAILNKKFPLIQTRTRFLELRGRDSGLTCTRGICDSAWNTITILFYIEVAPRPTAADCIHRFFSQGRASFGLEYVVGQPGMPEGVYMRGQLGDTHVTYARNRLERGVWYLMVIGLRGERISFGAYPLVAASAEERLVVTSQRGTLDAVVAGAHAAVAAQQQQTHIGYGFKGLIGWIHYFDKYANFEDSLHTEFTDSWVDRWHC